MPPSGVEAPPPSAAPGSLGLRLFSAWTGTNLETLGLIALTVTVIYAVVLTLTRIAGLRSFAEMSAFDFTMTVAVGTTFASTALTASVSIIEGAFALTMLFALQAVVARLRVRFSRVSEVVDNRPRLVARDGCIFHDVLAETQLTEQDLYAKLREANVRSLEEVIAVVIETTGSVSVIRNESFAGEFDPELLTGVLTPSGGH